MRCLLFAPVASALACCSAAPLQPPPPLPPVAQWIGAPATGPAPAPDPWLRRTFVLPAPPVRATARIASLGYHELWANGRKVGDAVLAPSVSDLGKRARYVDHDLTAQLRAGENAIVLWLAAGWAGFPEFAVPRAPLVRGAIDVTCSDGSELRLVTD
ncbi:MAG: hypothetical protein FJ265_20180, partial [Planctomycetes bacterium]|nr:hypothetical protein [Planctomycetota bacterium]